MELIQVDLRSRIPTYIQIIEQVKNQVAAGVLKAGDQLPTVRQLAADLRVNFNTVARAYRMLDESGLISTQHGRGTYIIESERDAAQVESLKASVLETLTRQFVIESLRLGSSSSEIRAAVEKHLNTAPIIRQE